LQEEILKRLRTQPARTEEEDLRTRQEALHKALEELERKKEEGSAFGRRFDFFSSVLR